MEISRNVILDLLPLYHAGEVSADTKALVEAYLRANPEFSQSSAALANDALAAAVELPANHEVKALEQVKRVIRLRSWLLGAAIFLSLFPFTSAHIGDDIRFFMLRDVPVVAMVSFVLAIASWAGYWSIGRRVTSAMR